MRAFFPVVGIGGSAGGLEAFEILVKNLPLKSGMAFVFIMHLAPGHKSLLPELLARLTKIPVMEVTSGMLLEAGHIYIKPPGANLSLEGRKLILSPRGEMNFGYLPIDYFFRSLAQEQGPRAIGVILSGTAADGTLGAQAIKAEGGITFAQDKTAKYPGMPQSAIDSGCVDFVLTPEKIARELERIVKHPFISPAGTAKADAAMAQGNGLKAIFDILCVNYGLDFTHYKAAPVIRRISRRMVLSKLEKIQDYIKFLRRDKDEVNRLYEDLLINVTSFFRDGKVFHALKKMAIPEILKNKNKAKEIRVWVPGCSSGEEAYSIAICFAELMGKATSAVPIKIFATDVDECCISRARRGIYGENIKKDITPERLKRFFVKEGGSFKVTKRLREMCIFSKHNLFSDPPFSSLNLISCRNMFIYLQPVLQKDLFDKFYYGLVPGGFLLLGDSESVSGYTDLFMALDRKQRIFIKKYLPARPGPRPGLVPTTCARKSKEAGIKNMAKQAAQSANEELEAAREELQSANEELITSNEELRNRNAQAILLNDDLINLLSSINMPLIMMGPDLVIRRITSQAQKVLNVIDSDIGRPISDIKLKVDIPDLEKTLTTVMETLEPETFEVKDHEGCWYSVYVRPYRALNNKTDGVVAVFVDITELKKIAKELAQANEQQYRTLINNLPQKVYLKDINSVYISCNENYARDLKIRPGQIAGKIDHDFFPTPLAEKYRADDKKVMESGKTENIEEEYVVIGDFLEGSHKAIINTVKVPVRDKTGCVTGLFGLFWDITEHKQIEETLRDNEVLKRLNQIKSDFVSTVSHELRTPLTPIRESVALVHEGILGEINEKQKRTLSLGLKNIDRLSRLIDNLLDISKIEAGKIEVNKEPLTVGELIDVVVETFSTLAKNKGLELKTKVDNKLTEVYADRDKTTQVLANLVGNAIKFTNKGYIEISFIDKGDCLECVISDTGQGVAPGDLPRLFTKFQQVGRGSDAGDKGTGLGLAISKGIVEAQGGKIVVKSKLGQGTDFTFTLVKYDRDTVLREKISNKIIQAQAVHAGFYLFLLKLDDYAKIQEKLGEEKIKNVLQGITKSFENIVRPGEAVKEDSRGQFIALIERGKDDPSVAKSKVKRIIKDVIFETLSDTPIDFSYGWATYPQDSLDADELAQKILDNMASEKEERSKNNILIVDDEPMIRGALRHSLKAAGYSFVDEAGDGEEAFEKIKALAPGLVILDMHMPKMNGYELIGRLKENVATKDIPILIMSGYKVEDSKLQDLVKGKAIPIVAKPFDIAQVLRLVDHLL